MKRIFVTLVSVLALILALSSCAKEQSSAGEKIVRIDLAGFYYAATVDDLSGQSALGEFIFISDAYGELKKFDGSTDGEALTISYTSFPVTDIISVKQTLDDSKLKDDNGYQINKGIKSAVVTATFADGVTASVPLADASLSEACNGIELKGRGTQVTGLYQITIDMNGGTSVTPLN